MMQSKSQPNSCWSNHGGIMASICDVWKNALGLCAEIAMVNLTQFGFDTIGCRCYCQLLAQGGAALAVFLYHQKTFKLKGLDALHQRSRHCLLSPEPTVYGVVTVPFEKKPFIAACISGCDRWCNLGFSQVKNYYFCLVSLLSLPSFIPQDTQDMSGFDCRCDWKGRCFWRSFCLNFFFAL